MNKQDMMKIQTWVLRVNIHCDCEGCMQKVKKKLQKVEGVHKVNIDVEQGKVTVSGNVDPSLLIEKLEKAGKHAELWGQQKGQIPLLNTNQFKNIQLDNMKDGKAQRGGFQVPQNMQMQKKVGKEEKFMGKDQKSVKFKLPEDEDEEDYEDDSDEFDDDDEFDYESDEDFGAQQPPTKVAPHGHGQKPNKAISDGHVKGGKNGGKGKKGGGINMLFKGMLGKAGGKKGNGGKKGESKKDDGGKNSKKNGGYPAGDGKNGAVNGKGAAKKDGGKGSDSWSKKGGEDFDGGPRLETKQKGFNEINASHKAGGGSGGFGGRNMEAMGQMGGFPAAQGMPAMNSARLQGMGQGNPYNQQYMAQMMAMNQQRGIGPDAYNPLAYMRSHPAMGYGPPMTMGYGPQPHVGYGPPMTQGDNYTHMFNDENTDSCRIM